MQIVVQIKKGLKQYVSKPFIIKLPLLDLNQRPSDYESDALTVWAKGPEREPKTAKLVNK